MTAEIEQLDPEFSSPDPFVNLLKDIDFAQAPLTETTILCPGSFYDMEDVTNVLGNDHIVLACIRAGSAKKSQLTASDIIHDAVYYEVFFICAMVPEYDRIPGRNNSYPIAGISIRSSDFSSHRRSVDDRSFYNLFVQTAAQLTATGVHVSVVSQNLQYHPGNAYEIILTTAQQVAKKRSGMELVDPPPFRRTVCFSYTDPSTIERLVAIDPPHGTLDPMLLHLSTKNMLTQAKRRITTAKRPTARLQDAIDAYNMKKIRVVDLYNYYSNKRFKQVTIEDFIAKEL